MNRLMNQSKPLYKKASAMILLICVLFIFIGVLTSIQPAYRLSSSTINDWTSQIKGSSFLHLMSMENKSFERAYPENTESIDWSDVAFQMATSVKPNDARSLLGRELPGFESYDRKILIAGEGTDYTNLTYESTPPLDTVLKDREAQMPEEEVNDKESEQNSSNQTTGDRDVVFIYNSHNRESFLPSLPDAKNADDAYHSEVNITKVSEKLGEALENYGVGTQVDKTDIMNLLVEKNWNYTDSYKASRPIVEEALASNKSLDFVFDLHRDSSGRKLTTKTIDGKEYGKIMFVIGGNNANYEKNFQLASELHDRLEDKYPGLSRGVEKYQGAGRDGVYNQDVSSNAITIEIGGVDNSFDELYRTADALAEVFSDYYWDAEKVQANP
ncbi:stage II sporulation protein P [Aquibacillus salsiterrae]